MSSVEKCMEYLGMLSKLAKTPYDENRPVGPSMQDIVEKLAAEVEKPSPFDFAFKDHPNVKPGLKKVAKQPPTLKKQGKGIE